MSASLTQAEQVPVPVEADLDNIYDGWGIQGEMEDGVEREIGDEIEDETRRLRRHLGLGESPEMPPGTPPDCTPVFFIERAPKSRNGAKCQLPGCLNRIRPKEYRVALNPGMNVSWWYSSQNSGKVQDQDTCLDGSAVELIGCSSSRLLPCRLFREDCRFFSV